MTATYPHNPRFILAALAGITILAAMGVIAQPHAVDRHGGEATQIRKCLDRNGPAQVWMSRDKSTFYLLCQIERGIYGIQAVNKDGVEKTAFVPGIGTWAKVIEYLTGFATRYSGVLPWLILP